MITLFDNKEWEKLAISETPVSKCKAAMPQLSSLKEVWKHVYHAAKHKKSSNTLSESQAWTMP